MTPRVARIITRLNVGGPAYQAVMLTHMLARRGWRTLLIAGRCESHEPQFQQLLDQYPSKVIFCPHLRRKINPLNDLAALAEVSKALLRFKPDIVHTHTAKAGLIGRVAGGLAGAKRLVHTFHGHVFEGYFPRPIEQGIIALERTLARRTDAVITVSARLADDLVGKFKIVPAEKCHAIELGLPLARFLELPERGYWREKLGIGENAIVLGWLGRLVRIKNPTRLIEVFAETCKLFPDKELHLIIGGVGPLAKQIRQRIGQAGLAPRVRMIGLIEDLRRFYADLDLVLLTSDNEGTAVTLLEAQAAGRFVVAPAVGGIPDIVGPKTGIVVSPNTTDSYVSALRRILSQTPLAAVDRHDRLAVIQRFSPDRLADEIEDLYRKLLP